MFLLHKHCHLNKFDIMEYTLPQIVELMKHTKNYIQFEVSTRMNPYSMNPFLGLGGGDGAVVEEQNTDNKKFDDEGFEIITAEGVSDLARALGGS